LITFFFEVIFEDTEQGIVVLNNEDFKSSHRTP
jgi:hypothetical protein